MGSKMDQWKKKEAVKMSFVANWCCVSRNTIGEVINNMLMMQRKGEIIGLLMFVGYSMFLSCIDKI